MVHAKSTTWLGERDGDDVFSQPIRGHEGILVETESGKPISKPAEDAGIDRFGAAHCHPPMVELDPFEVNIAYAARRV